jgi:hypothetical protein
MLYVIVPLAPVMVEALQLIAAVLLVDAEMDRLDGAVNVAILLMVLDDAEKPE